MKTIFRSSAALAIACASLAVQSAPVTSQGTWYGTTGYDGTLRARDLNGNAVALNDVNAYFIYDTQANVTWLKNFGGSGTWSQATTWASNLTIGSFSDWRLPTMVDTGAAGCDLSYGGGTDCGFNVSTQTGGVYSELAHLFYDVLGDKGSCTPGQFASCVLQQGAGLTNTGPFINMSAYFYWYDLVDAGNVANAWSFDLGHGAQISGPTNQIRDYVAVRDGDVLVGTVPEPESTWLSLLALIASGVAVGARRRVRREAIPESTL